MSLVTLGVADLRRARRFYETGGPIIALWYRRDLAADARIEDDESTFGGIALAHNVRSRDDVDAVLAEATAAGAAILKSAEETAWGGYSGYFADLDGHLWEVAWNPAWRIGENGSVRLT